MCALTHRKVLQKGCRKMGLRWEFMLVQRFFFCHGVEDVSDEQVTYGFQICLSILKELVALISFLLRLPRYRQRMGIHISFYMYL